MLDKRFVTAGRAIFTVVSRETGRSYTYRVNRKKGRDGRGDVFFVSLLTGPDNLRDYTYLGMLDPERLEVRLTGKSAYREDSLPVVGARRAMDAVLGMEAGVEVMHAGRCGRCGRQLTVPSSIESGLGPECEARMGA